LIRTYEAGIAVLIVLIALIQFVVLSAGRLGEQWDSTELDVEVKKALQDFQVSGSSEAFKRYSKIRDPDLLRMPQSESVGYRLLINGEPVDKTVPPEGVEVAATDAKIFHLSRDAMRLVPSLRARLLRSDYVQTAGRTMDYDSVDELGELILSIMWDQESEDILKSRIGTLMDNQNADGGWGFVKGEESDTLCTSMSIRALSAWIKRRGGDPLSNATVSRGISWLKKGVHADGGYGSKERIESSVDMTAHALLAFMAAGVGQGDPCVVAARDFLLRLQRPDGGFPLGRKGASQVSPTAVAVEALMAAGASQDAVERGLAYLAGEMITDGNYTMKFVPVGGDGTYDVYLYTGYVVDCEPRGHEFWGESADDSAVFIYDVYGDRSNMTVVLRIDRSMLEPPENKQKVALALSHNETPDTTDWWILNSGNPHTSGQGRPIDSPQFLQEVRGAYLYLTITDLQVPLEYDFFSDASGDWLIAIVGDGPHPIKDNPGRGYLIGYWSPWMKAFQFSNILAWRAWSPRINRVCLDVDCDFEFDDMRLTIGDSLTINGRQWILGMQQTEDEVNLTFYQPELGLSRSYYPLKYNLSTIPRAASGMYHFGVISVVNKPSFSRDYKVVLRDSVEAGVYDEAYIWNGTTWNLFRQGSIWNESGTLWLVGIEDDFLTLTRRIPVISTGVSGSWTTSLVAEGDFLKVDVSRQGPKEVWMGLFYDSSEVDRVVFDDSRSVPFRQDFGVWGGLRETSKVYHAMAIAEGWLADPASVRSLHTIADLCQQAIKFRKEYNSVIEDKLSVEAWFKSQGGG